MPLDGNSVTCERLNRFNYLKKKMFAIVRIWFVRNYKSCLDNFKIRKKQIVFYTFID